MKFFLVFIITVSAAVFGFLFLNNDTANSIDDSMIEKKPNIANTNIGSTNVYADGVSDEISSNNQSTSHAAREVSAELEERYDVISENDQYPTLLSRLIAIDARRPDSNYAAEDILSALEKSAAWETKKIPGPKLKKLTEEELNDGRQFVNFDPVKVETLMVGDHMDVAVDSIGRVFDMRIDSVRVFEDGNIMWKGPVTNADGGGSVTITQSAKVTVAAVVLAQDDFTLEAYGVDGWIVDSGTLFKVDSNYTDAVYPDEHD